MAQFVARNYELHTVNNWLIIEFRFVYLNISLTFQRNKHFELKNVELSG